MTTLTGRRITTTLPDCRGDAAPVASLVRSQLDVADVTIDGDTIRL